MEKNFKVVTILFVVIVVVISLIIIVLSPSGFKEQCKQKTNEIINDFYSARGGKSGFLESYQKGALSDFEQKNLLYLKNIIKQCPNIKSLAEDSIGINFSKATWFNTSMK